MIIIIIYIYITHTHIYIYNYILHVLLYTVFYEGFYVFCFFVFFDGKLVAVAVALGPPKFRFRRSENAILLGEKSFKLSGSYSCLGITEVVQQITHPNSF